MSTPGAPPVANTAVSVERSPSGSLASPVTVSMTAPVPARLLARSRSRSSLRATSVTWYLSSAKRRAIAAPRPGPAPMISTCRASMAGASGWVELVIVVSYAVGVVLPAPQDGLRRIHPFLPDRPGPADRDDSRLPGHAPPKVAANLPALRQSSARERPHLWSCLASRLKPARRPLWLLGVDEGACVAVGCGSELAEAYGGRREADGGGRSAGRECQAGGGVLALHDQ